MSRAERAKEYFIQGYNCSQAVTLAFADLFDVDGETLLKLALPFGGGLGRLRLICGAVSGMALVIGQVFGKAELSAENKKQVYQTVQELCAKFKQTNGSLICEELLTGARVQTSVGGEAEARTVEYYKKRPCAELVYIAADIVETYLREQEIL